MSAAWVAGGVRARAVARHRLGSEAIRAIAASESLAVAEERLAPTVYGRDVRVGQGLDAAQHAVSSATLWQLRVLAGWLPSGAVNVARVLVGPWEIANVAAVLASLRGDAPVEPFDAGPLGTIGMRLGGARTSRDVRSALTRSAWGDPRTEDPGRILAWLRMRWAERLTREVPGAARLGRGRLAILVARSMFVGGHTPDRASSPARSLRGRWDRATSIPELAAQLAPDARWPLEGIQDPGDLWRAELAWWKGVETAALGGLADFTPGRARVVVAAVALLGVDAWRARGALALAARGGGPIEAWDALA